MLVGVRPVLTFRLGSAQAPEWTDENSGVVQLGSTLGS